MAGGRQAVRLSPAEVDDLLAANLKVQVASIGPGGTPHLTTLFYVVDDGGIAFWTYASSQKVRNLRRDDRVSALIEDGLDYFELRGVSITGRARIIEDYDEVRRIGSMVLARMAGGADLGKDGRRLVDQQARKRVAVAIDPERTASWDHRKLTGPPGAETR